MSTVEVTIAGRNCRMACEAGDEARITKLAEGINKRHDELAASMPSAGDSLLLTMLLLMQADELQEVKKENTSLHTQIENVADSFEHGKTMDIEKKLTTTLSKISTRIEKLLPTS